MPRPVEAVDFDVGPPYAHTRDGGALWIRRLSGNCSSMALDPRDPRVLYVGRQSQGICKSENGGETFVELTNGLPASGFSRIIVAMVESNPDVLYAAFASGGDVIGTYRTDDAGATWSRLVNTPNFARPQVRFTGSLSLVTDSAVGSPGHHGDERRRTPWSPSLSRRR